jgi:protein-disulfide isomerase
MKKLIVLVFLLILALPATAQDPLPPGCNTGTLSQIFSDAGESLADEELTAEQAVFIIDTLDSALSATRDACTGNTRESTIDYSQIPQSRTEDGAFVLGHSDAPITIVEFADFMCPHCQTYHLTMQQVIEAYVATGMAKFEYRFFPVVDPQLSPITGSIVECAGILNPDGFWPAYDVMYEMTSHGFNSLSPFTFAARAGINYDDMATCVSETADQVSKDVKVGHAAGVDGTPTVMVRYGDGDIETIKDTEGNEIPSASVPFMVLADLIEAAQPDS